MQIAYLLMGQTGSYDDHTSWPVAVYLDKAQADAHHARAVAGAAALLGQVQHRNDFHVAQPTEFDPFFHALEGHVGYRVLEVPFIGAEGVADLRNWFALTHAQPVRRNPVEPSPEEQAQARAAFLAGLPRLAPRKNKQGADKDQVRTK
jgi:hypothetical protein